MLPISSLSSLVYTLTSLPLDLQPLNNNANLSISYLAKNKATCLSSAYYINNCFVHSNKAFACSQHVHQKPLPSIQWLAGSMAPKKGDMKALLPCRS